MPDPQNNNINEYKPGVSYDLFTFSLFTPTLLLLNK